MTLLPKVSAVALAVAVVQEHSRAARRTEAPKLLVKGTAAEKVEQHQHKSVPVAAEAALRRLVLL